MAALACAAGAAALLALLVGGGDDAEAVRFEGNGLGLIDTASNRLDAVVPLSTAPAAIVSDAAGMWVSLPDERTVLRVDGAKRRVVDAVTLGGRPAALAAAGGTVYAQDAERGLLRPLSTAAGAAAPAVRLFRPATIGFQSVGTGVAVAQGSAWSAIDGGRVARIDVRTGRILQRVGDFSRPAALAAGAGGLWIVDADEDSVSRIDEAGVGTEIAVGRGPNAVAVGAGGVWVANGLDDTVTRIDPGRGAAVAEIRVCSAPSAIAATRDAVWVANRLDGSVSRIDPRVNKVVRTIATGGAPVAIAADGDRLWVAARARPPAGPRGGGTAIVSLQGGLDSLDPAIAYTDQSWQLLHATCGRLLNYPDRPGQEGARLVPELATALPRVSNGGRTYTFTIRRGVRFAPPSRETVTAATMAHSLERSLSPRLGPLTAGPGLLQDVVGAEAYATGKAKRVTGIVARGTELSVTLRAPNGDLPARLAVPTFCAVPGDLPAVAPPGVGAVPSTGPYVVTDHVPGERVVLERNPRYRGRRPHRLERIEYVLGLGSERAVEQVLRGSVDYAADGLPPEQERDLARRYGPGSPAARAGHQQFFEQPKLETEMLVLNTARPLFADRRLRQAVSHAIDRKTIASLPPDRDGSGLTTLEPTDQFLPPGMPGFTDAWIYPTDGPDVAAARRLAGDRPRRAVLYICRKLNCRRVAEIVRRNLAAIRIAVTVRMRAVDEHFGRLFTRGEPFDLGYFGWIATYPDPGDFLPRLFDGSRIGVVGNGNVSYCDDPAFNRRLAESAAMPAPERYAAFGQIDHDLARAAPAVALYNRAQRSLFSERIGCQVQHPAFGVDLAALCVRGR